MQRRDFMRVAGGATVATAATASAATPVAAQEEEPDFGPYLNDARGFESTDDRRGEEELTVMVGAGDDGLSFDPAAIWIDPGTTITWEWTGDGGGHNVSPNDDAATSAFAHDEIVSEGGHTHEYTFTEEDAGISNYHCVPHEGQGMKGGIAVGEDVPTVDVSEEAAGDPAEFGADIHEHWVGVSVILMLVVSLVFTFFMLKYGESPHTSGGT